MDAKLVPPARVLFNRKRQMFFRVHQETAELLHELADARSVDVNVAASMALWVGAKTIAADPDFDPR